VLLFTLLLFAGFLRRAVLLQVHIQIQISRAKKLATVLEMRGSVINVKRARFFFYCREREREIKILGVVLGFHSLATVQYIGHGAQHR
jgi:hypothetical protein